MVIKFQCKGLGTLEVAKKLSDLPKEKPSLDGLVCKAQDLADEGNDAPGALRVYDQALKLYPGDSSLLNTAAWFLLTTEDAKVRDAKRALPLAREAVKLTKEENGNILDTLAKALHDTGELAEAARYGKMAAQMEPDNDEIVQRAEEYAKEAATK